MGIKGLTSYVKLKRPPNNEKLDLKVCHFDGNGLIWYFYDNTNGIMGGDYSSYCTKIENYMSIYTSRCDKIIIYFDGKSRRMKAFEDDQRKDDKEDSYLKLWEWLSEGANKIPDKADQPLPVLLSTQLRKSLERLNNIEIIECEEEADQEIAKGAYNKKGHYVFGRDSDFMLFDKINYVHLGSEIIDVESNKIVADVMRREELAKSFNLSESQFIDFCILLGNDYTNEWNRRKCFQFGDSRIPKNLATGQLSGNRVDELLEFMYEELISNNSAQLKVNRNVVRVNANSDDSDSGEEDDEDEDVLDIAAEQTDIGLVINFVRDLYDLNDLSSYPIDGDDDTDSDSDSTNKKPSSSSNNNNKRDNKYEIIEVSSIMYYNYDELENEIIYFINQVKKQQKGIDSLTVSVGATFLMSVMNLGNRITEINPDVIQYLALFKMQMELNTMTEDELRGLEEREHEIGKMLSITSDFVPSWTDYTYVHVYQNVCRILADRLSVEGCILGNNEPKYWFHGRLFYRELVTLKKIRDLIRDNNAPKELILKIAAIVDVFLSDFKTIAHAQGSSNYGDMINGYLEKGYIERLATAQTSIAEHPNVESTHKILDMDAEKLTRSYTNLLADEVATSTSEVMSSTNLSSKKSKSSKETKQMDQGQNKKYSASTGTSNEPKSEKKNDKVISLTDQLKNALSIGKDKDTTINESNSSPTEKPKLIRRDRLPIDDHRDEIVAKIQSDRLVIIHGETGCGKSSTVPLFLLEEAKKKREKVRMMVSQPRRIAVSNLYKRLKSIVGDEVGMRMGFGTKEETKDTKISFVTTGYLVRLLSHHPDIINSYTHLIIDEVHERSVDGDLVCMFARKLLIEYSHLHVILMSATAHTSLYQKYFKESDDGSFGDYQLLSVGARRFPVKEYFIEDVMGVVKWKKGHENGFAKSRNTIIKELEKLVLETKKFGGSTKSSSAPAFPTRLPAAQYTAVSHLVRNIAVNGKAILIFVSGINDIMELIDQLNPYPRFLCLAIHSDIPYEDQQKCFEPCPSNQVKVVIATNAAESSITLSDVDTVICLGSHKALQYNAEQHRTQLINTWISKASATQRSGRTGRVRPGTLYRMYTRDIYDQFNDFETAEVHRKPLEDVVLGMWTMLEESEAFEGVKPVLNDLIEPPSSCNLDQAYNVLVEDNLITYPDDDGDLTPMGRMTGTLAVDIKIGRIITYGILLGIPGEAVVVAAALSLPRNPFRYPNPAYFTATEYINVNRRIFQCMSEFDHGTYSEPIMLFRMLLHWKSLESHRRRNWEVRNCLVMGIMKQFDVISQQLCRQVNASIGSQSRGSEINFETIDVSNIKPLSESTTNAIRLILLWTASGNLLKFDPQPQNANHNVIIKPKAKSNSFPVDELRYLFDDDGLWTPAFNTEAVHNGTFIKFFEHSRDIKHLTANHVFHVLDKVYCNACHPHTGSDNECSVPELIAIHGTFVSNNDDDSYDSSDDDEEDQKESGIIKFSFFMFLHGGVLSPDGSECINDELNTDSACDIKFKNLIATCLTDVGTDRIASLHYTAQCREGLARIKGMEMEKPNAKWTKFLDSIYDALHGVGPEFLFNPLNRNNEGNFNYLSDHYSMYFVSKLSKSEVNKTKKFSSTGILKELPVMNLLLGSADISSVYLTEANTPGLTEDQIIKIFGDKNRVRSSVKSDSMSIKFTKETPEWRQEMGLPEPLFEDLEYGHRLFKFCLQKRKTGRDFSQVLVLDSKDNALAQAGRTVVGSAEDAAAQRQRELEVNSTAAAQKSKATEVVWDVLTLTTKISNMQGVKTHKTLAATTNTMGKNGMKCLFSDSSYINVSAHFAKEPYFGLSNSMMLLGASGTIIKCEGITLIPNANAWLFFALKSNGADTTFIEQQPVQFGIASDNMSERDFTNRYNGTILVYDIIKKAQHIVPIPKLRKLVDAIFSVTPNTERGGSAETSNELFKIYCSPRLGEMQLTHPHEAKAKHEDQKEHKYKVLASRTKDGETTKAASKVVVKKDVLALKPTRQTPRKSSKSKAKAKSKDKKYMNK